MVSCWVQEMEREHLNSWDLFTILLVGLVQQFEVLLSDLRLPLRNYSSYFFLHFQFAVKSLVFRLCIAFQPVPKNCSTPNPYPSPIHLVGVSIIIVKIYYSLLYYPTHPLSIYAEKIQLPSPHQRYQPQIFWVMSIQPRLKIRTKLY